jgi:hypothetical protein
VLRLLTRVVHRYSVVYTDADGHEHYTERLGERHLLLDSVGDGQVSSTAAAPSFPASTVAVAGGPLAPATAAVPPGTNISVMADTTIDRP